MLDLCKGWRGIWILTDQQTDKKNCFAKKKSSYKKNKLRKTYVYTNTGIDSHTYKFMLTHTYTYPSTTLKCIQNVYEILLLKNLDIFGCSWKINLAEKAA